MALYLTRFSYTPETWARLVGNPEDRRGEASLLAADEHPGLAAHGPGLDLTLQVVVIDGHCAVVDVSRQRFPMSASWAYRPPR